MMLISTAIPISATGSANYESPCISLKAVDWHDFLLQSQQLFCLHLRNIPKESSRWVQYPRIVCY